MRTQSINSLFNLPASQITTEDFWVLGNSVNDFTETPSTKLSDDGSIRKPYIKKCTK